MTTSEYKKPLPAIGSLNRPFWDATRANHLDLQFCLDCRRPRYPISHVCPNCLSEGYEWQAVSGKGCVLSTIVFHQVYNAAFATDVPYNVSLIQLEEGPRMFSNVVGVPPSDVKVGDQVMAVFDAVTNEVTIPRFRPVTPLTE